MNNLTQNQNMCPNYTLNKQVIKITLNQDQRDETQISSCYIIFHEKDGTMQAAYKLHKTCHKVLNLPPFSL